MLLHPLSPCPVNHEHLSYSMKQRSNRSAGGWGRIICTKCWVPSAPAPPSLPVSKYRIIIPLRPLELAPLSQSADTLLLKWPLHLCPTWGSRTWNPHCQGGARVQSSGHCPLCPLRLPILRDTPPHTAVSLKLSLCLHQNLALLPVPRSARVPRQCPQAVTPECPNLPHTTVHTLIRAGALVAFILSYPPSLRSPFQSANQVQTALADQVPGPTFARPCPSIAAPQP